MNKFEASNEEGLDFEIITQTSIALKEIMNELVICETKTLINDLSLNNTNQMEIMTKNVIDKISFVDQNISSVSKNIDEKVNDLNEDLQKDIEDKFKVSYSNQTVLNNSIVNLRDILIKTDENIQIKNDNIITDLELFRKDNSENYEDLESNVGKTLSQVALLITLFEDHNIEQENSKKILLEYDSKIDNINQIFVSNMKMNDDNIRALMKKTKVLQVIIGILCAVNIFGVILNIL